MTIAELTPSPPKLDHGTKPTNRSASPGWYARPDVRGGKAFWNGTDWFMPASSERTRESWQSATADSQRASLVVGGVCFVMVFIASLLPLLSIDGIDITLPFLRVVLGTVAVIGVISAAIGWTSRSSKTWSRSNLYHLLMGLVGLTWLGFIVYLGAAIVEDERINVHSSTLELGWWLAGLGLAIATAASISGLVNNSSSRK